MLFNSYIFIFVFLPLTLCLWYFLRKKNKDTLAQLALIGMSLWFYGYFHVSYLLIIVGSCLANFLLSFLLEKGPLKGKRTVIRVAGVVLNLLVLGYFKYYDFFIENVNFLFGGNIALKRILLPLGISFFTFQQMSYILDRCRGEAPHYSFIDYLTYITFFPQLIAGPIVYHSEFIPQIKDPKKRDFDELEFAYGISWFVFGLAKKVLIADTLAKAVDFGYSKVFYLDSLGAFVVIIAFTLELFFDFSGYCDMAIGIGKMFRIELPDNFDGPYRSRSVKEFWRRWHMTLGRFFTRYLYIPLGGSRKGKLRQVVNTMIVFTVSGLWHGANWTFVVWGVLHGVGVCVSIFTKGISEKLDKHVWYRGFCQGITFLFVSLNFAIFRADSLKDAGTLFMRLFAFDNFGKYAQVAAAMEIKEFFMITKVLSMKAPQLLVVFEELVFGGFLVFSLVLSMRKTTRKRLEGRALTKGFSTKLAILFVWAVISLSQVSTFLYFNF